MFSGEYNKTSLRSFTSKEDKKDSQKYSLQDSGIYIMKYRINSNLIYQIHLHTVYFQWWSCNICDIIVVSSNNIITHPLGPDNLFDIWWNIESQLFILNHYDVTLYDNMKRAEQMHKTERQTRPTISTRHINGCPPSTVVSLIFCQRRHQGERQQARETEL